MQEGPRVRTRPRAATLVAAAVVALAVAAGCGDDRAVARDPSTPTPRPTTTEVPTTAPAAFPAATLAEVGLTLSDSCPLPWLPVYAQDEQSYPSTPPTEVRPGDGTPFDLSSRRYEPPDTDGDGIGDEVLEGLDEGRAFGLRRSDGDLVLAIDGGSVGSPGGATWVGDLDDDGRDEVLVYVADDPSADASVFVVPGNLSPGRHDPAGVGVRVAASTSTPVAPVGDVDGDGADDLLLASEGQRLQIVAGPDVMAGSGRELTVDAPALASLPSDVANTLLLGDGRSVPVRFGTATDGTGATELTLMTEPTIVLRTDRVDAFDVMGSWLIKGFEADGHHYVQMQQQPTRSGTQIVFIWDLDDPCAGPEPAT